MCEPATIITAIIGGVSTGFQVAGAVVEGEAAGKAAQAQMDELDFQANQERRNAAAARAQARDVRQMGANAASETRAAGYAMAGEAVAMAGASGVELSGSVANLVGSSYANSEVDANRIMVQASREAWGLDAESEQREAYAKRLVEAKKAVKEGANLSSMGLGIRTGGQVFETTVQTAKDAASSYHKARSTRP